MYIRKPGVHQPLAFFILISYSHHFILAPYKGTDSKTLKKEKREGRRAGAEKIEINQPQKERKEQRTMVFSHQKVIVLCSTH
jgi:hypothetical protein